MGERDIVKSKGLKKFAWILVAISVLCSLTIWAQRIGVEKEYNHVQMVVNSNDVYALANGNQLTTAEMVEMLQERGVSAALFKELSIADLKNRGIVSLEVGHLLKKADYYEQVSEDLETNQAMLYVAILDKKWEEQIAAHLQYKLAGTIYYEGEVSVIAVPVMVPTGEGEFNSLQNAVKEIGVGFDWQQIEELSSLGLSIIPQVRSWDNPSDLSLRLVMNEIKAMPNLSYLLFNDKDIPGYPDESVMRKLADFLNGSQDGKPVTIGTIEFTDQHGLSQLGVLLNKNVVRMHTISNGEMSKYDLNSALDRWMLAVRERNMRSLLVRFFDIDTPAVGLNENLLYLETLQNELLAKGFTLDENYEKPGSVQVNVWLLRLLGIGVAAGAMLIVLEMRLPKLSLVTFVLASVLWLGLLAVSPVMARKLMALASVCVFPTLGCLLMMKPEGKSIGKTIVSLLSMSAISFIGAVLMVGLLADVLFMLKLDGFVGVKLAHVIPIVAVPTILYLWNTENLLRTVKMLLDKTAEYKWLVIAAVIAVAGMIYLSRTGNTTAQLSTAEQLMRTYLNDIMGVRPRTKEFMIGYPFAMLLFYFGASRKNWILTIPAIIGQVSLVNTYAHIHTPLLISLQRSLNGFIIGIVLGCLLIVAVKLCIEWYRKLEKINLKGE
ncbi:MAG: hypothetical protein IKM15_06840 [Peptococcaceae bacterium]|nr:hypothetical protein [Peptococcaceae bacterium]